jgi:predicted nucleotidyltransferase
MTRDEALAILTAHRDELAALGLRRLAVFGSVARDEAGPNSDVDVLVEFDGKTMLDRYAGLNDRLEDLLRRPVDLVTPCMIRPFMREGVEEDACDYLAETLPENRASGPATRWAFCG